MHTSGSMRPVMGRAGFALLFIPLAVPVVVGQLAVGRRGRFPRSVRSSCRRIASIVLSAG